MRTIKITILFSLIIVNLTAQIKSVSDYSFGENGASTLYIDRAASIELENDRILVAGIHASFGLRLYILNKDGTIDNSFGNNGIVTNDIAGDNFINLKLLKQDSKFLISCSGGILRYDNNGNWDNSFGTEGRINIKSPAIYLRNDNKILVKDLKGNVSLYDENGRIDNTFSLNDSLDYGTFAFDGFGNLYSIVSSDSYDLTIVSIKKDGTLNDTFGEDGFIRRNIDSNSGVISFNKLAIYNNKLLLAGTKKYWVSHTEYCNNVFYQLLINGLEDKYFGENGYCEINHINPNYDNIPVDIKEYNSSIYVACYCTKYSSNSQDYGYVILLDSTGIVKDFNYNGYFKSNNRINVINILTNGSIITTGEPSGGGWTAIYKYDNVSVTSSIKEKLWENPALIRNLKNEKLIIKSSKKIKQIIIYDSNGVIKKTFTNKAEEYDISNLNEGIYFVILRFRDNKIQKGKILKL